MSILLSTLKNLDVRKRPSQTQSPRGSAPELSTNMDETVGLDGEVNFKKEAVAISERLKSQKKRRTLFRLSLILMLIVGGIFIGGKPLYFRITSTIEPIISKVPFLASALRLTPPPVIPIIMETPPAKPSTPPATETLAKAQPSQATTHTEPGQQELPLPESTNLLLDKKLDFLLPPEPNDKLSTPDKAKPEAPIQHKSQGTAANKDSYPTTKVAQDIATTPTKERTHSTSTSENNVPSEGKKKTTRSAHAPKDRDATSEQAATPPALPTSAAQTTDVAKKGTPPPPKETQASTTPELTEVEAQQHLQGTQALEQARQALASGDIFRADSSLAKVDTLMRDREDYLATLAALEHRRGAHHRALGIYQRLLLRDPSRSQWLLGMALAQDRLGQGREALDTYRKTVTGHQLTGEALGFVLERIDFLTRQAAQQ